MKIKFLAILFVLTILASVANAQNNVTNQYSYFFKNKDTKLNISASAYVVGDLNTGEIILAKNQDQKLPIASISKLMTALLTKELVKDGDLAKVSKRALATHGGNGNFKLGEKIKVQDLLYPLLLESSNDAAEVLAEHYGRDSFISKMNQQAEKLQLTSTIFKDPSGLSASNKSTAGDIFKLAGYLYQKQPDILNITTKRSYKNKKHIWSNISQFLGNAGYVGGKSGYNDAAKETDVAIFKVSLAQSGLRPIGIVLLKSNDRKKDIEKILKYLNKNIYYGGASDATADWLKEKLNMPDIKDPDFVNLAFLGDIMLDRGVRNSVNKNFGGDYSLLFDKLNLLQKNDIVFGNLEGPASDVGKDMGNLYAFRMDPSVIPALRGAGIDILSVANNHMADWGREAYIDTLNRLKENEILYTGGGTLTKAQQPTIIEKYGMKIGYLAFSDVGPEGMEVTEEKIGVLMTNDVNFDAIIKNASKKVDYLIVYFHFGDEYQTKHNQKQEDYAHKAIDNGAKIVVGSNPHVIQDTEVYKNGYIAYSLGNFIFDQSFSTNTMRGMLLELKLGRDGSLTVKKNIVKLNKAFKPDTIILGKEEKIKFQETKPIIKKTTSQ